MAITWKTSGKGKSTKAGGGCLILFGLVFAGIGGVATFFLGREAIKEAATYNWEAVPCHIDSCEIEDDGSRDSPFRIQVHYGYDFQGKPYTSNRYTLQEDNWSDSYENLALSRKALLAEKSLTCFVDPESPTETVLKREGLKAGLMTLFPLVFVVIGLAIVSFGIAAMRKQKAAGQGARESISAGATGKAKSGWIAGVIFGSIFFLAGAGMLYPLAIRPLSKMSASKNWVETPCQVIWSHVRSHRGDDSTTYSVDIFYQYEFGGETHRSNTYEFFGGSSSGRSGKVEVIRQYPRGAEKVCYVNPAQPEQAVIQPGWSLSALFALFPLVFGGVGLLVMIFSFRARRKLAASSRTESASPYAGSRSDRFRAEADALDGGTGPQTLTPGKKRMVSTFGCLFLALFWNGIVSVFLYDVIQGFRRGNPEWFLTIFLIPFVLVGLALVFGFFYQLLSLANPRPVLTIEPGSIRLGEPFSIRWTLRGSASRVSSLKVSIRGIESATYQRGTNTHTSHEVFFADEISAVSRLLEVQKGEAAATIPGDLMHSFGLPNNKIRYELRINGDIPFWPDIQDRHELTVLPQKIAGGNT